MTYTTQPVKAGFFDVKFTRFWSLSVVTALWIVLLIWAALVAAVGTIIGIYFATTDSPIFGALIVLGSIFAGVAIAIMSRLALEGVAILFRIGDNTATIARNTNPLIGSDQP
jgi:hypothetical protein